MLVWTVRNYVYGEYDELIEDRIIGIYSNYKNSKLMSYQYVLNRFKDSVEEFELFNEGENQSNFVVQYFLSDGTSGSYRIDKFNVD